MYRLLTLLLTFLSINTYCQERTLNIPVTGNDTSYWYQYVTEISNQSEINCAINSQKDFLFRLWATNNKMIEVWKQKNGDIGSNVFLWVDICKDYHPKSPDIYYKSVKLNDTISNALLQIIDSTLIMEVPDEDSISRWHDITVGDGVCYIIEVSDKSNYSFKSYGNPQSRTYIPEAVQVQRVVDFFTLIANIETHWSLFTSEIPYKCYTISGYIGVTKPITHREYKRVLKNRRKRNKR